MPSRAVSKSKLTKKMSSGMTRKRTGKTLLDKLGVTHPKDRVKKRTKPSEREFQCPHANCNSAFTIKSNLNKHLRQVHESGQENVCQLCQKKLPTARRLEEHLSTVHWLALFKLKYGKKPENVHVSHDTPDVSDEDNKQVTFKDDTQDISFEDDTQDISFEDDTQDTSSEDGNYGDLSEFARELACEIQ
ncbi:hypothetical protein ACMFMF_001382 [Clarireedia jacksonii]